MTDLIYGIVGICFFGLCVLYTIGCERIRR